MEDTLRENPPKFWFVRTQKGKVVHIAESNFRYSPVSTTLCSLWATNGQWGETFSSCPVNFVPCTRCWQRGSSSKKGYVNPL